MQAAELARHIESLAPPPGDDEGFRYGDCHAEVSGVLVCWMSTVAAIEQAIADGCNFIICHEEMHFPYVFRDPNLEKHITWPVNRARIKRLAAHDLTLYRAHGMLDRFCILDDFGAAMGLPKPIVREGYYRIHEIPATTVGELAQQVKQRLGLPTVRVTGDLSATAARIGLPWGGLGLSINVSFINGLLEYGPDCLIAGETDEYAMRFVVDAGVPMIETGHSASENPGLVRFCEHLREQYPGLKVTYHECDRPWVAV